MEKKIRVLQIAHGMETFGGVESFLMQYYQRMDKNKVSWDFLFCCNNTLEKYVDKPTLQDSKITALHALKTTGNSLINYVRLISELNEYLKKNEYDIIHINTANVFLQFVCAIGLKSNAIRIAHSHSARAIMANPKIKDKIRLFVKGIVEPLLKIFIRSNNDYLFACSTVAGNSLFGQSGVRSSKFRIIKNAIIADKYIFNVDIRNCIRNRYSVTEHTKVYGTVGRLAESKNLLFLIDVFYGIYKRDPDSILWIIGEGPMRSEIERKIDEYDLSDYVKLLGEQSNVSEYLQAMDCFVFPTVYEGLGIVAIEAQAADLVTIVSDAVPQEAKVTDNFKSIELNKCASQWAEEIIEIMHVQKGRKNTRSEIVKMGYDISEAAERMCDLYHEICLKREY